jgi:hypothetical protein
MPFDKSKYPKDWPEISKRIKERDGWKCKRCRLPQYAIFRYGEDGRWELIGGTIFYDDMQYTESYKLAREACDHTNEVEGLKGDERYRVCVLTVAHLEDMDPMACEDANLAALCNRCHLRLDRHHHAANAAKTRCEKTGQGILI